MLNIPEEYCLCTNVNLGVSGAFNENFYVDALDFWRRKDIVRKEGYLLF